jgi:single-stranded DNA-specific DHH superfamily exonuclease
MAAGLSIKKENFSVFKKVFNDFIQVYLNNELPKAELYRQEV